MKKLTKIKFKYFIILIAITCTYFILATIYSTFMRYYMEVNGQAIGYGASSSYTITYTLNGGTQAAGQPTTYSSTDLPITLLEPTRSGYTFQGWFDNSSFNGNPIATISSVGNYSLFAKWVEDTYVAEVNGTYYTALNLAIYYGVPADDTQTVVRVLKDITVTTASLFDPNNSGTYTARISIPEDKNVVLDMQNHSITNSKNVNTPIIENVGTLTISSGTISTSANQGAINNNTNGTLYVNGTVTITGSGRQAIYNDGGYLHISGNPTISSTSKNRAAVQNHAGTTVILGGTITSSGYYGVYAEAGSLTIGAKDGTINKTSPIILGTTGVQSSINYSFYDGVLGGTSKAVNDQSKITDYEIGATLSSGSEAINGKTYKTLRLIGAPVTVTFNATGGTASEASRTIEKGATVGALPTATHPTMVFDGWYTLAEGGVQIDENTIITEDVEFFAHWTPGVAEVNGIAYATIEDAIKQVPNNNTQTTVNILDDIIITSGLENAPVGGRIKITNGKNIVLNIGNNTIRNQTGVDTPIIVNRGRLTIVSGTVFSDSAQGVINNETGGNLTISGGNITATGTKQALYNNGGTATITGTAVLSSTSVDRAAVHNLNNGTITITGGTITSSNFDAVLNVSGTVTIGDDDGTISQTPVIRGETYGVNNTATFNYYDGTIMGVTGALNGTVPTVPTGYHIDAAATEVIDETTYIKATLVADN